MRGQQCQVHSPWHRMIGHPEAEPPALDLGSRESGLLSHSCSRAATSHWHAPAPWDTPAPPAVQVTASLTAHSPPQAAPQGSSKHRTAAGTRPCSSQDQCHTSRPCTAPTTRKRHRPHGTVSRCTVSWLASDAIPTVTETLAVRQCGILQLIPHPPHPEYRCHDTTSTASEQSQR